MNEEITAEVRPAQGGAIGILTLNASQRLNSLSLDMVRALSKQLRAWQTDDSIAAVFLQGAGEKALCAGGDVHKLYRSAMAANGGPNTYAETFFHEEYRLDYLIHTFGKPVICWGHGIVMGGGLGLMAGASHKVGTERTRIAMPEITIGLYPDVGGSYFLNRMPHQIGLFLGLTATSLNLTDALFVGLVDYTAPSEKREEILAQLCSQVWLPGTEEKINHAIASEILSAYQLDILPPGQLQPYCQQIESACSEDTLTNITNAILRLPDDARWLQQAKAALRAGSPLSARLIHEQLQRCANMSLADVFRAELLLSTHVVRQPDFAEGVRALLIDKDSKPRWQFDSIEQIPKALIETCFAPPWARNPLSDL
ncbi:enoyl-CoA hydratase/isomerase family protein [Microbulbifer agarilyticus]|uniref:enoyl-CoA hydratase/isomerase family protein n=1 Tax=Microbulbifer agarilyticus TaxID=260552 RepID=UPI001C96C7A7|nr:enoyl-CoA hydratase/isomerase family protein [Microbulbifer agarilyticus]MBY6211167.1 enoyl-CoA hydratase/isomerase family protein [Microbulbifer agarilyticus]